MTRSVASSAFYVLIIMLMVRNIQGFEASNYTVIEHGSLTVQCNATERAGYEIYWTKSATNSTFYQAGRNLIFTDILRGDSGDYVCHVFNTSLPGDNETNSNVTVEVINIDVQYPMEILDCTIGPAVTNENGSFSIAWNIQGNPAPNWEIINVDTGNVVMGVYHASDVGNGTFNVMCGFTGYWECNGLNALNHGGNQTRGSHVTVLCAPRRDPYKPYQPEVMARTGTTASFSIDTVGSPKPSFTWSRVDGQPLHDWIQDDSPTSSALNISHITLDDFTNYTVTINNTLGTSTVPFRLIPHGSPERPYDLNVTALTYHSVDLSWTSGFDMGSTEIFYIMELDRNQYKMIDVVSGTYNNSGIAQHWTYKVSGLSSDTAYNMTVRARNSAGFESLNADHPVFLRTKVDPNIPIEEPQSKMGIIVGAAVGGIVVVGLLAVMAYFLVFKRKRNTYYNMKGDDMD